MTQNLLDAQITLDWLPDETLFSLVSRHHQLSGALQPWVTCKQFFGHKQRGSAHDFPSRLDLCAARTGLACDGSALALERTLLPFYLPWRTAEVGQMAVEVSRGERIGSLKFGLGLLTSRFGAQHPLKACLACMEEDAKRFGVAYWHRAHQWPGVWTCLCHRCALLVSQSKMKSHSRFAWALPSATELASPVSSWREGMELADTAPRLARLADFASRSVAAEPSTFCDPGALSATYRTQMVQLSWLKHKDRLKWGALDVALRDHLKSLAGLPEFARLIVGPNPLRAHLGRLLYPRGTQTHPLRHLLLIEALFTSWSEFAEAHREVSLRSAVGEPAPSIVRRATRRATVDVDAAMSARALGRLNGVDTHTAMVHLAAAGIAPRRRPKVLKPSILMAMITALKAGVAKEHAATLAGVSVSTVTRVLRTEPGLQVQWHQARWQLEQRRHQEVWSKLLVERVGVADRLLRLEAPATYAWLYRNDRPWLMEKTKLRGTLSLAGNHALVKWRGKDAHLAHQIRHASIWLSARGELNLPGLCNAVPELEPHLRRLYQLPVTQRTLLEALRERQQKQTLSHELE